MFELCFANTIDTTVLDKGPDGYFVFTGDIGDMWLRDSSAQAIAIASPAHCERRARDW